METNLTFIETYTIGQFKQLKNITELRVLQSPKTGKLFLSWVGQGKELGFVSTKGIPKVSPVISWVEGDAGRNFYLLHEEGVGGAPTMAVL